MKVRTEVQPGIISKACGATYQLFVEPNQIDLTSSILDFNDCDCQINDWMELLEVSDTTTVLAQYKHPYWGQYSAITCNDYGKGSATYIGCHISSSVLQKIYQYILQKPQLSNLNCSYHFPLIIKNTVNNQNKQIRFYFNYSEKPINISFDGKKGKDLLSNTVINHNDNLYLKDWGVLIIALDDN